MKALAFAAALSLTFSCVVFAQDSKPSPKPNGLLKQPAEAAANIDVAAIQKKIDEFSEAIKKNPQDDGNFGARGQCYKRIGKLDSAMMDLNKAISMNPGRAAYFEVRANCLMRLNRPREAFDDYKKAFSLGLQGRRLNLDLAYCAAELKDYRSAVSYAKTALETKQNDKETLVLLGGCERMAGLLKDSLEHLTKAIELDPTDGEVIAMRADTYNSLGQKALAIRDMKLAKRLGVNN